MKCYICEEIKEKGQYIHNGYYMQISIEKSVMFDNRYLLCARSEGRAELDCNYCPKCGRRLNRRLEI